MASGPEGSGDSEGPLQRRVREAREALRKRLGGIDSDASRTAEEKKQQKEQIARQKKEELSKNLEEQERLPEGDRDPESIKVQIEELAELVQQKVFPHIPELAGAVVVALAAKKVSPARALLIGEIVSEILDSPQFHDLTRTATDRVKQNLQKLARRYRNIGHPEVAETIEEQVKASAEGGDGSVPPEGPRPPEGPLTPEDPSNPDGSERRGGRNDDDEEKDEEPIERYLKKHYRKARVDRRTKEVIRDQNGNVMYEGWLDILQDDSNYVGLSAELQKSLLGQAILRQIPITPSQMVLVRAFDGPEEFKAYFLALRELKAAAKGLPEERMNEISINEVYKEMSNEVKELIRQLLSSLSGTVDTSQKDAQFIDLIKERIITRISREIAGDTDIDTPNSVELVADTFLPAAWDTPSAAEGGEILMGGGREYIEPRTVKTSLSDALVNDLTSTIDKLKKITVGFHNARDFAYSGGSHKDFAEGIKRDGVKPGDLNWAFKKEDDVNLAYNLLIQSLQQLKAQTARTITERYGAMSKVGGLTEAEYRAWIQLLSLDDKFKSADQGYKDAEAENRELPQLTPGQEESDEMRATRRGITKRMERYSKEIVRIRQRKLRAIKMASGIAWGYSKEAWGVLLDAHLLTKRVGENGEWTTGQHYGGSQSVGIEKMVAELHPVTLDNRWGRDKIAPIWMLYQPRDLEAARNAWEREDVHTHTRLYDLYDQHQKAFYSGRTDELADFDDKYVTVHEFANVTSLHMLRRESWRLAQYNLYAKKYEAEARGMGSTGMEAHEHVIKRLMMRGGPRLVKMYIDSNYDKMAPLDREIKRRGLDKSLKDHKRAEDRVERRGKESSSDKKALIRGREAQAQIKERYYEKFIFDDISKRFSTSLIALEQPRYMPKGEKTMFTALNTYVERLPFLQSLPPHILQTEVYPIYIDAIHSIERNKWENYYRSKDANVDEDERVRRQLEPAQDLTDADFNDPAVRQTLQVHFELNKERIGKLTDDADPDKYRLNAGFDEYFNSLKGFYTALKQERDGDRYNRTSILKRKRQSLSQRYAHMLVLDQGGVNQALGGSYFDFTLEIQQGGADAINRLGSDTVKSAEMTEAWNNLTGDGGVLEKFAMSDASTEEELKSGAKSIAEGINKICEYPYGFSPDQGNEYKIRHEIFWAKAFAKPEVFRGLLGQFGELYYRTLTGHQTGSLFSEYYKTILGRTQAVSLDADKLRTVLKVWEKELRIPMEKYEVTQYENVSDMPLPRKALRRMEDALRYIPVVGPALRAVFRTYTSPLTEARGKEFRTHDFHQGMAFKELGARKRDVFSEKAISVESIAGFFAFLFAVGEAAGENKK